MIFILLIISAMAAAFFYVFYFPKPITSVDFYGVILNFRADLREAEKIPLYPNESAVNALLMDGSVRNITIAFKPSNEENSYFALEATEIVTKLYYAYKTLGHVMPKFMSINVSSYENLSGTPQNPMIALVAPSVSNETDVIVSSNNVISVKAKSFNDFDLATIKMIMAALKIKVG
jgi:hypothetical protein